MKNPHGVEPTRFMKSKKDDAFAILCEPNYGPVFGGYGDNENDYSMYIYNRCNKKNGCSIGNNGTLGFKSHHHHKKSLFVDTAEHNEMNYFSLLDYEVYCIDYKNKHTIEHLCKHPDIIWEYIETKDISEESLKQFDDANELLNDMDTIYCEDNNIRLKISKCCLKNPSELLPDTQFIDKKYDSYLREWLGSDYQWRLIYRSSEHG